MNLVGNFQNGYKVKNSEDSQLETHKKMTLLKCIKTFFMREQRRVCLRSIQTPERRRKKV